MDSENELIRRVAQGDRMALKKIYEAHAVRVYNMILNRFKDTELANDITQDVFVTVYEKSISFRGDAKVGTWILRIALNKCIDELKQKNKTINRLSEGSMQSAIQEEDIPKPVNLTTILSAVDQLRDSQKEAFTLVHLDKIPQQEAAEVMNMKVKAFESLLYRARLSLQKIITKNEGF